MKIFNTITAAALIAAAATMPVAVEAVPAYPHPITVTQPDGTTLTIRISGDERHHITTTSDGYLLVAQNDTYYYATVATDGVTLMSSGIKATDEGNRSAEAMKFLSTVNKESDMKAMDAARAKSAARRVAPMKKTRKTASQQRIIGGREMLEADVPATGVRPGLVVLVEYTDVKFTVENPREFFSRMMNEEDFSEGRANGSARDYFVASSRGQYLPDFKVYGPVSLAHNRKYYGGNDNYGQDKLPYEMAIEAVRALDDEVDFSIFDTDGDGDIDNITVIYAGQGEADGGPVSSVWPHAYWIADGAGIDVRVDGVRLNHYNCINEWVKYEGQDEPAGIGTFCHEFSHILGLPDLYATTTYGAAQNETPNYWSIMDYGPYMGDGHCPPLHSAYEAYCLGWINPQIVDGPIFGVLDGSASGNAYMFATDKENEFFIFENRTPDQIRWDKYLPSAGMLIWHIDYDSNKWYSNTVNNTSGHQNIDLVEADGIYGARTNYNDAFPGGAGGPYTDFTMQTIPAFKAWSGYDLGLPVTEIALDRISGEITFKVKGGADRIAPTEVTETSVKDTDLTISWESNDNAIAYELNIYNEDRGRYDAGMRGIVIGTNEAEAVAGRASTLTYTIEGLRPSTNYSVKLRVVAPDSRSEWSDLVDVRTAEAAISTIAPDNSDSATPVYYNLQGVRIANPVAGQIVIERRGEKSTKTIIK